MARVEDVETAHAQALNLDAQRALRIRLADRNAARSEMFAADLRMLAQWARLSVDRPAHAVLEVAGTFLVGQGKATRMVEHARRAVELFPLAVELLECGALLPGTVEILLWATAKATEPVQEELGRRVISQLIGCDAGDARELIRATLLEVEADLDLEAAKERHAQARANRGVWVKPVEDGMARIGAEVDQLAAQRFQLDLESLCRLHKRADQAAGIDRTAEQRRADVLADLPGRHLTLLTAFQQGKSVTDLLRADAAMSAASDTAARVDAAGSTARGSGAAGSTERGSGSAGPAAPGSAAARQAVLARLCALPIPKPTVLHVHTPMSTALELDNRSGWVEGLGPISAHHTRLLRPTAALQALWVDADTGQPLGVDPKVHPPGEEPDWQLPDQAIKLAQQVRDRLASMVHPTLVQDRVEPGRFPSDRLARFIALRDLRCTGPGCAMPASRCENDHLIADTDGGPTAAWNLGLKSPRCHHAKHDGWTTQRDDTTGSTTWTSPTGGVYVRRSPWRPPPKLSGPLPPPTLDRPDGGKKRTFGQHSDPEDADPSQPADSEGDQPAAKPSKAAAEPAEPDGTASFSSRPWHTDGPPPF